MPTVYTDTGTIGSTTTFDVRRRIYSVTTFSGVEFKVFNTPNFTATAIQSWTLKDDEYTRRLGIRRIRKRWFGAPIIQRIDLPS